MAEFAVFSEEQHQKLRDLTFGYPTFETLQAIRQELRQCVYIDPDEFIQPDDVDNYLQGGRAEPGPRTMKAIGDMLLGDDAA